MYSKPPAVPYDPNCPVCRDTEMCKLVDYYLAEKFPLPRIQEELRKRKKYIPDQHILRHAWHKGYTYLWYPPKEAKQALKEAAKTKEYKETQEQISKIRGVNLSLQEYKSILDHLIVVGYQTIRKLAEDERYARNIGPILRAVKESVSVSMRIAQQLGSTLEDELREILSAVQEDTEKPAEISATEVKEGEDAGEEEHEEQE